MELAESEQPCSIQANEWTAQEAKQNNSACLAQLVDNPGLQAATGEQVDATIIVPMTMHSTVQ